MKYFYKTLHLCKTISYTIMTQLVSYIEICNEYIIQIQEKQKKQDEYKNYVKPQCYNPSPPLSTNIGYDLDAETGCEVVYFNWKNPL